MSDLSHEMSARESQALNHRRAWFGLFPEGSVEFLLPTRILLVVLLLAMAGVHETQRSKVFLALCLMLWADYSVVLWWTIQAAADLCGLESLTGRAQFISSRLRAGILVSLPSAALFLLFAPWQELVFESAVTIATVSRITTPLLLVLYLLLLFPGLRVLKQLGFGSTLCNLLLLVPLVHWFALHRLLTQLRRRIHTLNGATGHEGPALAIPLADATWVVGMLPWIMLLAIAAVRQNWFRLVVPCGALLAAVFSVADVAAIEGVQRELASLLRKTDTPASRPSGQATSH